MMLSAVTSAEPVFLRTKKASEESLTGQGPHVKQALAAAGREGKGREVGWEKQASLGGLAER